MLNALNDADAMRRAISASKRDAVVRSADMSIWRFEKGVHAKRFFHTLT